MTTIIQLDPPLPVRCPKGNALAHFLIEYGIEHHLYWVVFLDMSGECWTYDNTKIRAQKNITMDRLFIEKGLHHGSEKEVDTKGDQK